MIQARNIVTFLTLLSNLNSTYRFNYVYQNQCLLKRALLVSFATLSINYPGTLCHC